MADQLPTIEGTPQQQVDAFQDVMRSHRALYNQSPDMQAGFKRAIEAQLAEQAAGQRPAPSADIDAEIRAAESVLFADRARWNRDEKLQARHRELLRMKLGG